MKSFYELTPDAVLESVESKGLEPTGYILQLNSYENRVFEIELENKKRVVAKFYRPGRWSYDAIHAEHQFLIELSQATIRVAAPLRLDDANLTVATSPTQETISQTPSEIYWSLFHKVQGRLPQELLGQDLERVGRLLAQVHNIGAQSPAPKRFFLGPELGDQSLEILKSRIAPELSNRYEEAAHVVLNFLEDHINPAHFIRIHGDAHRGNLLDSGTEFFFVDFDDFCNGPVAQDFWMLIAGDEEDQKRNLEFLLRGYEELRHFDDSQINLFEPLRGLRLINYTAWIARRWEDPSFPKLFPEFGSYNYWSEEVEALERIAWAL